MDMDVAQQTLFDRIQWRDPTDGAPLRPIVQARTPAGVPICGFLVRDDQRWAWPIVDSVARLTPESAHRHADWLRASGHQVPHAESEDFQGEATVDHFAFQWSWNSTPRTEADLRWRVAERYGLPLEQISGQFTLDAGAGAGDQSQWLLKQGGHVLSIDLSGAIDVAARKLRHHPHWFGVQGDLTRLPLADDQLDMVYCEGVIQHTRDSAATVRELARVLRSEGLMLATHYAKSTRMLGKIRRRWADCVRARISKWDRYQLLAFTGITSTLGHTPLIKYVARGARLAIYQPSMPDFKTTWCNTFDEYGNHEFQRYVSAETFWSYFEQAGDFEAVKRDHIILMVRKKAPAAAARAA